MKVKHIETHKLICELDKGHTLEISHGDVVKISCNHNPKRYMTISVSHVNSQRIYGNTIGEPHDFYTWAQVKDIITIEKISISNNKQTDFENAMELICDECAARHNMHYSYCEEQCMVKQLWYDILDEEMESEVE
jgi:hypothetical protein